MKTTKVLGVATVLVLLSGCSLLDRDGHTMGGKTTVSRDINVVAKEKNTCSIDPNVPVINIGHGNSGTLVFHVKPASTFKFTSKGIDFSKSGAPSGEFTVENASDTTWTIHDRNKTKGSFKYEVNVVPKAPGGVPCNLDPTVWNDGSCTGPC